MAKSGEKVIYVLAFITFSILPVFSTSLYSSDDPLWELNSSNFPRIVLGKNNAWIIEFYNSWCGHCINFAPVWKAFSKDIQNWRNVIDVGVVNCADKENIKLCRDYNVEAYPTIKLFPSNIDENERGTGLMGERDLKSIRHTIINFLESQPEGKVPSSWPSLKPLESNSLGELWSNIPKNVDVMYIFTEPSNSALGKEVILDLSSPTLPPVNRVLSTNSLLLNELIPERDNSTFLLKVKRDGTSTVILKLPGNANDTYIRDKVFESVVGRPRIVEDKEEKPEDPPIIEPSGDKGVYLQDLENAIVYALRQEVGVHGDISGPELFALKSFLSALKMYFPGNITTMNFLTKLSNWVMHRRGNLSGETFLQVMDQLTTEKEFLPDMQDWIGCKGSKPQYRGYPCSLWTLFHTLTVQAYNMYENNPLRMREDPRRVLFAISGYVKYFFTCKHCSQHFQQMASSLEEEVEKPEDTVLWLWRAHNKVNKRLSGDTTEDPSHKKIQFPSEKSCPKCRLNTGTSDEDIQWDTKAVLRFLQSFYGKKNIVTRNSETQVVRDGSLQKIMNHVERSPENSVGKDCQALSQPTLLLALLYIIENCQDI